MFTSSPPHTDTYPATAIFPVLRRDWLANAGTILTVHAGSRTLCSIFDILVAGVGCPSASEKILMGLCYVWMKGSHSMLAWYVHDVSQAVEGIYPSNTPCLTCCSISVACGGFSLFFLCVIDVYLCGCCHHFVLS